MRSANRAAIAAVSSVAGFAIVLLAHPAGHKALATASQPARSSKGQAAATSVPAATTAPANSSGQSGQPGAGGGGASGLASAVGSPEQYGYGVMSVKVTVRGHHIVDVSVVNLQTAEQYSQSLAEQVIPLLRHEVLTSQTTQVYAISGATYTSEAYVYSAQSALDKLHA